MSPWELLVWVVALTAAMRLIWLHAPAIASVMLDVVALVLLAVIAAAVTAVVCTLGAIGDRAYRLGKRSS